MKCRHGDETCPCPDGDPCHYVSLPAVREFPASEAMTCLRSGKKDCDEC